MIRTQHLDDVVDLAGEVGTDREVLMLWTMTAVVAGVLIVFVCGMYLMVTLSGG